MKNIKEMSVREKFLKFDEYDQELEADQKEYEPKIIFKGFEITSGITPLTAKKFYNWVKVFGEASTHLPHPCPRCKDVSFRQARCSDCEGSRFDWSKFRKTRKWQAVAKAAKERYGSSCQACGQENGQIDVDHIRPVSLFPKLKYDLDNMQILCQSCNASKGNKRIVDYRR